MAPLPGWVLQRVSQGQEVACDTVHPWDTRAPGDGAPCPPCGVEWKCERKSMRANEGSRPPGCRCRNTTKSDADLAVYPRVRVPPACAGVGAEDVVLTTHITLARLPALVRLAGRWLHSGRPDPARGCLSVAIALCSAGEWAAVEAAFAGDATLAAHVQLTIVLGDWRPFYPFNVMRNAALEPWNSAAQALLPGIRDARCAAAVRSALDLAAASGGGRGSGALDMRSPPGPLQPLARPWLFVLDVDGVPSGDEGQARAAMARAEAAAATSADDPVRGPPSRRLYTFVTFQPPALATTAEALYELTAFLALAPGNTTGALALAEARFTAGAWERQQRLDMLTSLKGRRGWFRRPADSEPRLGRYRMHAEPYFIGRAPLPFFIEPIRGREAASKSSWWFLLAHSGEYTAQVLPHMFIFMDTSFDLWLHRKKAQRRQLLGKPAQVDAGELARIVEDGAGELARVVEDASGSEDAEVPRGAARGRALVEALVVDGVARYHGPYYWYALYGEMAAHPCHLNPNASAWGGKYRATFTPDVED